MQLFRRLSPARVIALGFLSLILLGSVLLSLPCCIRPGVELSYIDALYTSTSAVCVTGLIAVDAGDTFTVLGQTVLALLIQIGGLGVTAVGAGIILALGRRMNLKSRSLVREAMNLDSGKGVVRFVKSVFITTLTFQVLGAALSYPSFSRDYPPLQALWISLFHSIAAFNNAGFDILGGFRGLTPYRQDVLLNLVTCGLIYFGGIGFLTIQEMRRFGLHFRRYSMHAKTVLSTSAVLLLGGALLLLLTEDIGFLAALFHSVSARTAGFSTHSLGSFSPAGLVLMMALMFVGASPGSTGGGVKTTTVFVLMKGIASAATNRTEKAFRYAIPKEAFQKAAVIVLLALVLVLSSTWLLLVLEPQLELPDALFEMVSAFATVGLSTGITPGLGLGAKILSVCMMYIGRLGPLTVATLWYFGREERVRFPEGDIAIG
ncbi:MAG: H(+)-transporting ATPase [Clostridia bacterium]|nr:H(+)-transporting ATPase [Clostridia bacterium]